MISGNQMDEGTWSMVLGTFRKAPSLEGAYVVTEIINGDSVSTMTSILFMCRPALVTTGGSCMLFPVS
jgi:hypothetical protein